MGLSLLFFWEHKLLIWIIEIFQWCLLFHFVVLFLFLMWPICNPGKSNDGRIAWVEFIFLMSAPWNHVSGCIPHQNLFSITVKKNLWESLVIDCDNFCLLSPLQVLMPKEVLIKGCHLFLLLKKGGVPQRSLGNKLVPEQWHWEVVESLKGSA